MTEPQRAHAYAKRKQLQDIAFTFPPPPVDADARLRAKCDGSLRTFLEICFPSAFPLEWSDDHLQLIDDVETAADAGLLRARAMPRGSGKSSIFIRAALWSILTGRRRFVVIIGATELAAVALLKSLKIEILHNPVLARLYGREIHSLLAMEGEARRASGQRYEGEPTGVEWLANQITFGNIPDVATSGAAIATCGLTGNIRGQQATTADGEVIRPDLILIDDPQTKESASSDRQCQTRYELMMGDVLGLAGPGRSISAVCALTIIYRNDLAHRLLDRELSPEWNGVTCRMVYAWPKNLDLWEQYRSIRESDLAQGGTGEIANQFYRDNRAAMDKGARVAWPARYDRKREVSAIQHAFNLRFRDEAAFFAEYQNDPLANDSDAPFELNAEKLSRRITAYERRQVPDGCEKITAFIDVQKELLYFAVMSWTPQGRGYVIDYGSFPDQRRAYFGKRDVRFKLSDLDGVAGLNEAIYTGLSQLTETLLSRQWSRDDGAVLAVDRLAIDARWGYSTRVVRRFCRESENRARLFPSMGQFIGANSKPWHKFAHVKGDRLGVHCKLQPPKGRGNRELLIDVNFWKSFLAERLLVPVGSDRAITLFNRKPHLHRMIAEHCCAEDPQLVTATSGNAVIEWKANRNKPDNDLFDCLVGCCVLASLEGVAIHTTKPTTPKAPPRKRRRRNVTPLG